MKKYGIVVVGYQRVDGIMRLLKSLNDAYYDEEVPLIISIDYSESTDVYDCCDKFVWEHGEKRIIKHTKKMGLKKHIISCGELLNEFDAIVVLEDDLMVSRGFYSYVKESVEKYYDDMNIAGISLYSYNWNVFAKFPFTPSQNKYDNYFMQLSQSWGQIWMKKQWFDFIEWLEHSESKSIENIPTNINKWGEKSWLKHHIKYCVDKNRFFVYPYCSLTTCFSESGEHTEKKNYILQVPLLCDNKKNYCFSNLNDVDSVKYDVFFERIIDERTNNYNNSNTTIDLYGSKHCYKNRFLLSTKNLSYKIIKKFALEMIPHEDNFLNEIKGDEIKLYDTSVEVSNNIRDKDIKIKEYYYRHRIIHKNGVFKKIFIKKLNDYLFKK